MMRRGLFFAPALLASAALLAGSAFAGGFRIPEQGAAAMGQANAFVGQADDASAVQFNPAGITQLPGNNLLLGGTSITVKSRYTSTGGVSTDMKDTSAFPPIFYYTNHLGTGNWWLGLGVTSPFGLASDWEVPTFNYIATKTNLEMVKINPTLAYKVNDALSLGLGVDYYDVLEAEFKNDISSTVAGLAPPNGFGVPAVMNQTLKGKGNSYGYNLGALYKASDRLFCGFIYRSGTISTVEGDIDINIKASGTHITLIPAKADLKLPATAALGICYQPTGAWKVNLDLDWTGWSAYDELRIVSASSGATIKAMPKNYKDTTAYRLGASYALDPSWILRGGFLMDSTPIPDDTFDPRLPDGDRTGYSLGAGYKSGPWSADLALMFVDVKKNDVDNNIADSPFNLQNVDGSYKGSITLIGFNVGYSF